MKSWLVPILLVAAMLAAVTAGLAGRYRAFVLEPLDIAESVVIEVERGDTVKGVLARLQSMGLTRVDWKWELLLRSRPVVIQAGEYRLEPGLVPPALLDRLVAGDVVRHAFTIVEGWTFQRLRQALAADPILVKELPPPGAEEVVMGLLGAPEMHPEGWFLPETYHFTRGDSDLDLLRRAHQAMKQALEGAWDERSDIPLKSPYELLILASIVEKETALDDERPLVAGVFSRRLQQGWKLETDPTVIYGLGEGFDGDIRRRDLRTDTPYNTYTRRGLPPTPIALPGLASLLATARPVSGSAMFFVADGNGGHVFSDTLAEHEAAVRQMLRGGR